MRDIFPKLIGNDRLRRALSGNLSHAYIIEGSPGSGRLTAVRCAAAASLCENKDSDEHSLPCGKCSVCSRIFRGIHPDVSEFSSGGKKSIGVDVAREIRSQVFITPSESEYKFFVIKDADLMTPEAQNALLISLEEPPPYSIFFLIVSDKSLLLETIRSRCVILNTERLSSDVIEKKLLSTAEGERLSQTSRSEFEGIIKASDGSLGKALGLLEDSDDTSDETGQIAALLVQTVLSGTSAEKVKFTVSFPKTRETQTAIFTRALFAVRDIISHKTRSGAELMFYGDVSEFSAFSSASLAKLMTLASVIDDARTALAGNSSPVLTAERVIMYKL